MPRVKLYLSDKVCLMLAEGKQKQAHKIQAVDCCQNSTKLGTCWQFDTWQTPTEYKHIKQAHAAVTSAFSFHEPEKTSNGQNVP